MRRPPGLGSRGAAFWQVVSTTYDLTPPELELLVEAVRLIDEVDRLERAVRRDGVTIEGRPNPGLASLRQHRLALGKILAQLDFPDADNIPTLTSIRAKRAAASRWAGHVRRHDRKAEAQ